MNNKSLYFLIGCLLILGSCSKSGNEKEEDQRATENINIEKFSELVNLFNNDYTEYLGSETITFPLPYDSREFQDLLKNPIPKEYESFINLDPVQNLDFVKDQLQFDHPFYPVAKYNNGDGLLLIVYFATPELPRQTTEGHYYFMLSYSQQGALVDAYPIAFSNGNAGDSLQERYFELFDFSDVTEVTRINAGDLKSVEYLSSLTIDSNGNIRTIDEPVTHLSVFPNHWNRVEEAEDGTWYAEKYCDAEMVQVMIELKDPQKPQLWHLLGQDAEIYDILEFKTSFTTGLYHYSFRVQSIYAQGWKWVTVYYDDPENFVSIWENLGDDPLNFVEEGKMGSVKIVEEDCDYN